ncbi:hypothetical protein PGT21_020225 [Puccinia graminis f. sp. tritici]|uniref:Uncharacterized protein n=1 Tax=Puccinia graminis f. sp. tritici TaxID=56615 RepID=A0A5B0Q672_PUCGR|nr:hypothetical protein PGT21_020225 [Puccinia graminis f. sp. tritici]
MHCSLYLVFILATVALAKPQNEGVQKREVAGNSVDGSNPPSAIFAKKSSGLESWNKILDAPGALGQSKWDDGGSPASNPHK